MDGQACVEVDYSYIHPLMLYAEEGINYNTDIGGDIYDIPLKIEADPIKARKIIKKCFLILINAKDEKTVFQAIRQSLREDGFTTGITNVEIEQNILTPIKEKHPQICSKLMTGAGLRLMYADSEIARRVINQFVNEQKPILCVHDSFIVQAQDKWYLMSLMEKSFQETYPGIDINLKGDSIFDDNEVVLGNENHSREEEINDRQLEYDAISAGYPGYLKRLANWNAGRIKSTSRI